MRDWLIRLFRLETPGSSSPKAQNYCARCASLELHNHDLRNQVEFLQTWLNEIKGRKERSEGARPIAQTPQPWNNMRKKLEEKYSRNREKPEDKVQSHWENKIREMESVAGLNQEK